MTHTQPEKSWGEGNKFSFRGCMVYSNNSQLMQTVYWRFPIPEHMPMCTTSSNGWELPIVISAGDGSVCGITDRSLITMEFPQYREFVGRQGCD